MINAKKYLYDNLFKGLKTPIKNLSFKLMILIISYAVLAFLIGCLSGVLEYKPLTSNAVFYLPLTLFFIPSIFEEILFRGLILPIELKNKNKKTIINYIILSTVLFVLWHPFMALINPVSATFFFNPYFLLIVMLLGITCSLAYIYSQSLWLPIVIHWLTVLIWVILLGGRNLILDNQ